MPSALVPIFFLSGIAGLTFETLWFRLAGLSLGNSIWSASLVLAAFMGGLMLGNGLVARLHSRVLQPIRVYALLEIGIGIASFLVVLALPRLSAALGPLFVAIADTPWLLNVTRLGSAFALLVIPTTAMGATLPLLTEAMSRSNPSFGATLGKLYGWNTLGAMLGAIGTEAILVRFFGIVSAGLIATLLNLLAGVLALRLAATVDSVGEPAASRASAPFTRRIYRYLLVALISGAVMLGLEVVWFRFLLLSYTGTGLTFALMLAIVLAGIGIGGLAAGRLARNATRCHEWLRHVTALSGLLVVATYYGFDLFTAQLLRDNATFTAFVGFALFLMLPVSTLSGATFTFVAHAVKEELGGSMRATGIVALWNTAGATAGSLAAGFVLLPALGMERSLFALAATYCATALLVPAPAPGNREWVAKSAWGTMAVTALALALFPFGLMERSFFKVVDHALSQETRIATREGLTQTMRYYRRDAFGAPQSYRLVTDGYSMSGTTVGAKRYMKLYVYLPLALRADTRDALLISYGVGSTAKALTDSAALQHIDVVDISREILELGSIVYPGEDNPLRDPRVDVHIEDGRFFLGTRSSKYDLITSEPPPPKVAGVVNLYTQEYFEAIRDHLTPHGRTTYWLPVLQLQPLDTLAIIKAFCNVFEDCTLWDGSGLEWMLMGGNGTDERVPADAFAAQWRDDRVRPELVKLGFETPEQIGALFMGDASYLAELTGQIPPVTDNYPLRISSELPGKPARVSLYDTVMDEGARLERFVHSAYVAAVWPQELAANTRAYFRYEGFIKQHLTAGLYPATSQPFVWDELDDVLSNTQLETLPLWLLGTDRDALTNARRAAQQGPVQPDVAHELALGELAQRDYRGALRTLEGSVAAAGGHVSVGNACLLLYLLGKNGRTDDARRLIASFDPAKAPIVADCVGWFGAKFNAYTSLPSGAIPR